MRGGLAPVELTFQFVLAHVEHGRPTVPAGARMLAALKLRDQFAHFRQAECLSGPNAGMAAGANRNRIHPTVPCSAIDEFSQDVVDPRGDIHTADQRRNSPDDNGRFAETLYSEPDLIQLIG